MDLRNAFVFVLSHTLQITSTPSDPELGFTIMSCFISPNSNPSVASDYTLIETVCPTDDSVTYYPQRDFPVPHAQTEKKIFSFTFSSKFNMSLLFLHCELSLCSKRSLSSQRLLPVCSVIFYKLLLPCALDSCVYKLSVFCRGDSVRSVCSRVQAGGYSGQPQTFSIRPALRASHKLQSVKQDSALRLK